MNYLSNPRKKYLILQLSICILLRSLATAHLASCLILNGMSSMFVAPTLGNAAILAGDGVKMAGNFSMPFCMKTEKKIKKEIGV